MEIWKQIPDLPGYSVSNKGRVKKDSTGQIMVLSKMVDIAGLQYLSMYTVLLLMLFLKNQRTKKSAGLTT